ncbi:MAG: hypothetical protein KC656_31140, partial [Myxococcales bacterium]|nr:hypothetical protein [Myxococcales bacterium]
IDSRRWHYDPEARFAAGDIIHHERWGAGFVHHTHLGEMWVLFGHGQERLHMPRTVTEVFPRRWVPDPPPDRPVAGPAPTGVEGPSERAIELARAVLGSLATAAGPGAGRVDDAVLPLAARLEGTLAARDVERRCRGFLGRHPELALSSVLERLHDTVIEALARSGSRS